MTPPPLTYSTTGASPSEAAPGVGPTTDPFAPFDAIMLVTYGGPYQMDDVLPFMRNATAGRGVPDERLLEVAGHYRRFNGASPINARNEELRAALETAVRERGSRVPVVVGNRNWHPFMADTLRELLDDGASRVLVLLASAYASYSGCRQYREDLARAKAELSESVEVGALAERVHIAKNRPYYTTPGFLDAVTDATAAAWEKMADPQRSRIAFVTHSIPVSMDRNAGPPTYVAQHEQVCQVVAERLRERYGQAVPWDLVYCSRSGPEHVPWLEPDINDHLEVLAEQGVAGVAAVPMGFTSDHMEVVFDLDVEAAETAAGLGLDYVRGATVGTDPRFVASLVHVLEETAAAERGESLPAEAGDLGPWPAWCRPGCCAVVARHPQGKGGAHAGSPHGKGAPHGEGGAHGGGSPHAHGRPHPHVESRPTLCGAD